VAEDKKSVRRRGALIVFEDESGFSLLPAVRATWAPRGKTPVLRHRFNWKRLSMASALAYEPDGSDARLVFQMRPGAYNDETLIEFLTGPLHASARQLGQPDRAVLLHPAPQSHPQRQLHFRPGPHRQAPRLHQRLRPESETIRMDLLRRPTQSGLNNTRRIYARQH
jgi:hypothetical protein